MTTGDPEMLILHGNSISGNPLIYALIKSSNLPHTLLKMVTVIGTSELGGSSPSLGVKTTAIPLLF